MAQQKQPFRFRLPWLSVSTPAAQPSRPLSRPQAPPRPPAESEAPTQPNTSVPVQRPPFRPAGIAPVQPPPLQAPPPQRPTPPPRTEPQPPLQPNESPVTSKPAPPSRATTQKQAPLSSLPPSPSRTAAQPIATSVPPLASEDKPVSQPATQPRSPSRLAPKEQTSSQPSSPVRTTNQVQPLGGANSQPASPPKKLQPETNESSLSRPSSTLSLLSTSQKQVSLSQETKTTSEMILTSQPPVETSFQPSGVAAKYSQEVTEAAKATLEIPDAAQKQDSIPIIADSSQSENKLKEIEERKDVEGAIKEEKAKGNKAVEELRKEKIKGLVHQEPTPRMTFDSEPTILRTSARNRKEIKVESATHSEERKPTSSDGERAPLHKKIPEDISKLVHNVATKQPMDEGTVSVITVAGENRGATMHIGSASAKTNQSIPIHRGYKLKPDESPEATTDVEEKSVKPITNEDPETKAYINSNAQSINNSIVFNSSIIERNPGVQLEFSRDLTQATKSITESEATETRKSEFNRTPAQKHTYEPVVKRRCLRGLFMEPDDSDPDDHTKPRRHGCHYSSCEKGKDKDVELF